MHATEKRKRSVREARFPAPTQPVNFVFRFALATDQFSRDSIRAFNDRLEIAERSKYFQLLIALFELGLIRPASFQTLSLKQNFV